MVLYLRTHFFLPGELTHNQRFEDAQSLFQQLRMVGSIALQVLADKPELVGVYSHFFSNEFQGFFDISIQFLGTRGARRAGQ